MTVLGVVIDVSGGPADERLGARVEGLECIALGPSRQIALVRSRPAPDALPDHPRVEKLESLTLVGRARLDGRRELEARLSGKVQADPATVSDARLCLIAYATWGDSCLDFLAGDFSFAIWDDRRQRLFAACDQLGKRPLFHARRGTTLAIANAIDFVADVCAPDRVPDDFWIADFLTLNSPREIDRTAYRDIRRLAPGHAIAWHRGQTEPDIRRYWRLELGDPLFLPREADYLERFRDLVMRSIEDRLPRGLVGISMSGGLDSTTLAACAVRVSGDPRRVTAYCEHYERLMHIGEDEFANLAARHLGIDLEVEAVDDAVYDPRWQMRGHRPGEPLEAVVHGEPLRAMNDRLASRATIWFDGEGPDNALALDRDPYLSWLWRKHAWGRLAGTLLDYARVKGLDGWLQSVKRHSGLETAGPDYDFDVPWIAEDLARRVHLEERARDLHFGGTTRDHPWHPRAMQSFTSPIWQDYFRDFEFQEETSRLQWLHPYLDLRVLQFLLSVPPLPWAWKKSLVRRSMRGWLPEPILRRPKTPLPVSPLARAMKEHGLPDLLAPDRLAPYVEAARLPGIHESDLAVGKSIFAYVLDHWLATMPGRRPASGRGGGAL